METYWCVKKDSIVDWINHSVDFSPELIPYKGSGCPMWKEWEGREGYHHLIKAGKHGRQ